MKHKDDLTPTQSWIVVILSLLFALFADSIFNF